MGDGHEGFDPMRGVLSAMRSAHTDARLVTLKSALVSIRDTLGAALTQALPTDDPIIIGHIREAHAVARMAVRECE